MNQQDARSPLNLSQIIKSYYDCLFVTSESHNVYKVNEKILTIISRAISRRAITFQDYYVLLKDLSQVTTPSSDDLTKVLWRITSTEQVHIESKKVEELRAIERHFYLRIFYENQPELLQMMDTLKSGKNDIREDERISYLWRILARFMGINKDENTLRYIAKIKAILSLFRREQTSHEKMTTEEFQLLPEFNQSVYLGYLNFISFYYKSLNQKLLNLLIIPHGGAILSQMTQNILTNMIEMTKTCRHFSLLICLQFNWPLTLNEIRQFLANGKDGNNKNNLRDLVCRVAENCLNERKICQASERRNCLCQKFISLMKRDTKKSNYYRLELFELFGLLRHVPDSCLRAQVSMKICQFILWNKIQACLYIPSKDVERVIQSLDKSISYNHTMDLQVEMKNLNLEWISRLDAYGMLRFILHLDAGRKRINPNAIINGKQTSPQVKVEWKNVDIVHLFKVLLDLLKREKFQAKYIDLILLFQISQLLAHLDMVYLELFEELHRYLIVDNVRDDLNLEMDLINECYTKSLQLLLNYNDEGVLENYQKIIKKTEYIPFDFSDRHKEFYYQIDMADIDLIISNVQHLRKYRPIDQDEQLRLDIWISLNMSLLKTNFFPKSLVTWLNRLYEEFDHTQLINEFEQFYLQAKVMDDKTAIVKAEHIFRGLSAKYLTKAIIDEIMVLTQNARRHQSSDKLVIIDQINRIDLSFLRTVSIAELLGVESDLALPPEPVITYILILISRALFQTKIGETIELTTITDKLILFTTLYATNFYDSELNEKTFCITKELRRALDSTTLVRLDEVAVGDMEKCFYLTSEKISQKFAEISRQLLDEIHPDIQRRKHLLLLYTVLILNANNYGSILRIRRYLLTLADGQNDDAKRTDQLTDIQQDEYQIFLIKMMNQNEIERQITYLITLLIIEIIIKKQETNLSFVDAFIIFFTLANETTHVEIIKNLGRLLFQSLTPNRGLFSITTALTENILLDIQYRIDVFLESFKGTFDESLLRSILCFRQDNNLRTPFICYLCVEDNRELFQEFRRLHKLTHQQHHFEIMRSLKTNLLLEVNHLDTIKMKTSTRIMIAMATTVFARIESLHQCLEIIQGGSGWDRVLYKEMSEKSRKYKRSLNGYLKVFLQQQSQNKNNNKQTKIDGKFLDVTLILLKKIIIFALYTDYKSVVGINSLRLLMQAGNFDGQFLSLLYFVIQRYLREYRDNEDFNVSGCLDLSQDYLIECIKALVKLRNGEMRLNYIQFLCLHKGVQSVRLSHENDIILKVYFSELSAVWQEEFHDVEFLQDYLEHLQDILFRLIRESQMKCDGDENIRFINNKTNILSSEFESAFSDQPEMKRELLIIAPNIFLKPNEKP